MNFLSVSASQICNSELKIDKSSSVPTQQNSPKQKVSVSPSAKLEVTVPSIQQIQLISEGVDSNHFGLTEYKRHLATIKENASSTAVFNALMEVLHIHATKPSLVASVIRQQENIPDLNSIYNKCLINILMYEDATLLLQAEKLGEKYSLNIHPYMKSALELLNKDI
ncbi:hypothetical protein EB796_009371 [Bugula neritina]|uniref:Uncharacterized protein n=1 Tax=Bugula neritina TaxID=10212 RepID=A0A7J7K135_BUGNE|nr:hypothetical protein EB796_009371 [Bugula neritina]